MRHFHGGGYWPCVEQFVCHEAGKGDIAGVIVEYLEAISKEEVDYCVPPAEGNGEVLSREYLIEETKAELSYYSAQQKLNESANVVNTYPVSGPPAME